MRLQPVSLFVLGIGLLCALACAGATECADGTTAAKDQVCPGGEAVDPTQDPEILTFTTNLAELTVGGSVGFTAVVTDPQGVGDVIGGTLLSEGGATTYGSFEAASEGSYEVTLTWDELNTVERIDFDTSATRVFIAQFYDQDGNIAEAEVELRLVCPVGGESACGGRCVNFDDDGANCGECGNTCPEFAGTAPVCDRGGCVVRTTCQDDLSLTCEDACAADGYTACNPVYAGAAGTASYYSNGDDCNGNGSTGYAGSIDTCTEPMQVSETAEVAFCYCTE